MNGVGDLEDQEEDEEVQQKRLGRILSLPAVVRRGSNNFVGNFGDKVESLRWKTTRVADKADAWAAGNRVGRMFRFKERKTKLTTELRAGLITFLMVAYILAVNPNILSTTGGTCNPEVDCKDPQLGSICLANTADPLATNCMEQLKKNLITATAASSLISTFFIGYFANLPLALAPGMGINAYVAYQVVGQFGQGDLTYQQAMAAIFIEGWIFIVLSLTGVRSGIIKLMPKGIAMAASVGIGLLLAFTGLVNLGVIVFDKSTYVTLGGCNAATHRTYVYEFDQPLTPERLSNLSTSLVNVTLPDGGVGLLPATAYGCRDEEMRSPTMWLGIGGGLLMAMLLYAGVKGALIIGIAFITIISWIPGHAASYLGADSAIPGGQERFDVFKQVVAAPTLDMTGLAWDWSAFTSGHLWLALFTFLYIDLLDCTGCLFSMARLLDFSLPGFLNEDMEFPGEMWAFLSDGIGILAGSMMGTTPLTVFIESAAGIEDGGRTGLTAIVVSFFFFVSLFFSPILASIPPYATGPALILVGTILLGHIAHIEWDDIGQAIPAFLTIILMPFTYSVAYGVIAGLVSYFAIHLPFWLLRWLRLLRRRWQRRGAAAGAAASAADISQPSPDGQLPKKRFIGSYSGYHIPKLLRWSAPRHPDMQNGAANGGSTVVGGSSLDGSFHGSFHSTDSRRAGLGLPTVAATAAAAAATAAQAAEHHPRGMVHSTSSGSFHGSETERGGRASLAIYRKTLPTSSPVAGARATMPHPPSEHRLDTLMGRGLTRSRSSQQLGVAGLGTSQSMADDGSLRRGNSMHGGNLFRQSQSLPRLARDLEQGRGGAPFKLFPDDETTGSMPTHKAAVEFKLFPDAEEGADSNGTHQQDIKLFPDNNSTAAGLSSASPALSTDSGEEPQRVVSFRPHTGHLPHRSNTADLSFGGGPWSAQELQQSSSAHPLRRIAEQQASSVESDRRATSRSRLAHTSSDTSDQLMFTASNFSATGTESNPPSSPERLPLVRSPTQLSRAPSRSTSQSRAASGSPMSSRPLGSAGGSSFRERTIARTTSLADIAARFAEAGGPQVEDGPPPAAVWRTASGQLPMPPMQRQSEPLETLHSGGEASSDMSSALSGRIMPPAVPADPALEAAALAAIPAGAPSSSGSMPALSAAAAQLKQPAAKASASEPITVPQQQASPFDTHAPPRPQQESMDSQPSYVHGGSRERDYRVELSQDGSRLTSGWQADEESVH